MCRTWFRLRQSFRGAAHGGLPPNAEVTLPIGLERHAFTIGGPDRKAVVPSIRQPPDGTSIEVIDVDDRLLAVLHAESDAPAIWRDPGCRVITRRNLQQFDAALSIIQDQLVLCR